MEIVKASSNNISANILSKARCLNNQATSVFSKQKTTYVQTGGLILHGIIISVSPEDKAVKFTKAANKEGKNDDSWHYKRFRVWFFNVNQKQLATVFGNENKSQERVFLNPFPKRRNLQH